MAATAGLQLMSLTLPRLYRLAFEKAEPGAIYHAVDEEGVPMKAIAEAHGRGLKVPVVSIKPQDAEAHFGWLARFAMPRYGVLQRDYAAGAELVAPPGRD